ncbi:hypothetical protein BDD12DRAFT_803384 [Trichophaea hybrida]|nr:hypothetical protein BDD12DRAFT_803384 [Trichophaea hybrida]
MAQTISPGAYVISNRNSSAVHANGYENGAHVSTSERDEERHRERQIWWIEADPGFDDVNNYDDNMVHGGCVYRISNIAKDISLDEQHDTWNNGAPIIAYETYGAPWQLWNFRRLSQDTDGEYYNIVNAYSGYVLDAGEGQCCTRKPVTKSERQAWELHKPVVSVPAGWLRLQNFASGYLLSQTYPSLLPLAIPETASFSVSKYPEPWAT